MKESISNALFLDELTSRILNSNRNVTELVVTIIFAILISEVLALLLYRLLSIYAENRFYSTFHSYASFMLDLIDENEDPFIPSSRHEMMRSGSHSSLDERKIIIEKSLQTRQWDNGDGLKADFASESVHSCSDVCIKMGSIRDHDHKTTESVENQCAICLNEFSEFLKYFSNMKMNKWLNKFLPNESYDCLFVFLHRIQ